MRALMVVCLFLFLICGPAACSGGGSDDGESADVTSGADASDVLSSDGAQDGQPNPDLVDDAAPDDTAPEDTGTTALSLPPADFAGSLTESGGCVDTWVRLWNPEQTIAIEVFVEGALQYAIDNFFYEGQGDVTDGPIEVRLLVGDSINQNFCTDMLETGLEHQEFPPVLGKVRVSVYNPGEALYEGGLADVSLWNVHFEDETGNTVGGDFGAEKIELLGMIGP